MATDSAYNYALLKDTYNHQLIYDAGWIFYYLLWGAAALHPSMRTLEEPAPDFADATDAAQAHPARRACLIAPGIRLRPVLRQPGRARSHRRLRAPLPARRREDGRARTAGGARGLARARPARSGRRARRGGRPGPGGGRPRSPPSIVCSARSRRCASCSSSDGSAVVEASSDGATGGLVGDGTRDWLSNGSGSLRVLHSDPPAYVRGDLRLPEGQTTMVAPLTVRGDVRGALVVSSPESVTRDLVDALGALATQVSLAVEGASLAEDLHRRQSEARFRSLVAHSSDLITVLDARRPRHLPEPVDRARARIPRPTRSRDRRFDRLLSRDRPASAGAADRDRRLGRRRGAHDRVLGQSTGTARLSASRSSTPTSFTTSTSAASC